MISPATIPALMRRASGTRADALPVPSGRYLMLARRAWNASVFEHDEISRNIFWLGNHTSMSYVFVAEKPMSPEQSVMTRYGKPSPCKMLSAWLVRRSSSAED